MTGRRCLVSSIVALLAAGLSAAAEKDATDVAGGILASAGLKAGACVEIGCTDGRLAGALARRGGLLVHALALDAASAEKARGHLQTEKLYGQATVELLAGKGLPYADDLINLVVVSDWPKVAAGGVGLGEVLRVVCPRGVVFLGGAAEADLKAALAAAGVKDFQIVQAGGAWAKIVKPRPAEMDDWTHRFHDAGLSNVSADATDPAGNVRWLAGPPHPAWGVLGMGNSTYRGTVRGMVSAGGRYFCLSMSAPRNLNLRRKEVVLVARDAHNGLLLWSRSVSDYMADLGLIQAEPPKEIDFVEQLKYHSTHGGSPYHVGKFWEYATGRSKEKPPAEIAAKVEEHGKLWAAAARRSELATAFGHTLAAVGERVFGVIGGCPVSIDAASGRLLKVYEKGADAAVGAQPGLLVEGGTVVVSGGGSIRAYQAESGKRLWKQDGAAAAAVALGGGKVYALLAGRGPAGSLLCLDLATGQKAWQLALGSVKHAEGGKEEDGKTWPRTGKVGFGDQLFYKDGRVVLICGFLGKILYGQGLHVLSPADGREVWSRHVPAVGGHYSSISFSDGGGLIWVTYTPAGAKKDARVTEGMDPATGAVVKTLTGGLANGMCGYDTTMIISTERYFINTRPVKFMSRADGKVSAEVGVRGVCTGGAIVANGLTYFAPQGCDCVKASLRSFGALAARRPVAPEGLNAPRLEKGPAFGQVGDLKGKEARAADDWPTYRHDNQRSGATAVNAGSDIKGVWEAPLEDQAPAASLLAADWSLNTWVLTDPLTAPVVAGGRVYVAGINSHRVFCLDAATGKRLWSFTAGGRVDASPTIHKGLCLFGARDGYAYCLRADDGALVWRFRAAPQDYLIMAYGQFESPSPVVGGVTAEGDVAYFGAGRTGSVDASHTWYALDLATGKVLKTVNAGPRFTWPDMLVGDGSRILACGAEMTVQRAGPGKLPYVDVPTAGGDTFAAGLVDRFWRHAGMARDETARRTGGAQVYRGAMGRIVVGRAGAGERVYLFGRFTGGAGGRQTNIYKEYCAFAAGEDSKGVMKGATEPKPLWSHVLPEPLQIEAMALAGEVLFVAGPTDRFQRKTGFLWALSPADGRKLKEIPLPAPPTGEGLAVAAAPAGAPGRLYLSTQDGRLLCFGNP